jgi:hypothetical protein
MSARPFASIQYSILPLLYVLLGGAGTVLGPFVGTLLMFYLIDLSSTVTTAHLLVVGARWSCSSCCSRRRASRHLRERLAAVAAVSRCCSTRGPDPAFRRAEGRRRRRLRPARRARSMR